MIPGKALLAALPLALGGGWLVYGSTQRIGALRSELARVDSAGRQEGESFVRTLRGSHAERQLALLTERRDRALELARARRDRLLGLILVISGVLAYLFVRTAQRLGDEMEEAGRLFGRSRPGRRA